MLNDKNLLLIGALPWFLLLFGTLPLVAQGEGILGSNQLEPQVRVTHRAGGALSELVISACVPQGVPSAWVGISTGQAAVPIAGTGGVIGVATNPPAGGNFLLLGPFNVDPQGEVRLPWVVPVSFVGLTLFIQAANADSLAQTGYALSDAEAITFSASGEMQLAMESAQAGAHQLVMAAPDGSAKGPVLGLTAPLNFMTLSLSSRGETMDCDYDLPFEDGSDAQAPRIRVPGGHALWHYRTQLGQFGFFATQDHGKRYTPLLEAPAAQGADPFEAVVAVSPFEPLAAVIINGLAPGFPGAQVFLMRLDGENLAGSTRPVRAINGLPLTADISADSLTFVQGALFFTNELSLWRVATNQPNPTAIPVALPSSGGVAPQEVDEDIAWSRDGSTIAFTAGASESLRDVFVVSAQGSASNVTQAPGEIENVSYRDLQDGGRLALAPDGTRVAFVRDLGTSVEVYVKDTGGPALLQVTDNSRFTGTVEQEVSIGFYTRSTVGMAAGGGETDQDVYRIDLTAQGGAAALSNVTATSGSTSLPFQAGSTLTGEDLGGLGGEAGLYVMRDSFNGRRSITRMTGTPSTVVLESDLLAPVISIAQPGFSWLAVRDLQGARVVSVAPTGAPMNLWVGTPGESVSRLRNLAEGALLTTTSTAAERAYYLNGQGTVSPLQGLPPSLGTGIPSMVLVENQAAALIAQSQLWQVDLVASQAVSHGSTTLRAWLQ